MIGTNFGIFRPNAGSGGGSNTGNSPASNNSIIINTQSNTHTSNLTPIANVIHHQPPQQQQQQQQQQHIVIQQREQQPTIVSAQPIAIPLEDYRPQGTQLSDFILQLEDYVPTVPDAVTAHYLNTAGFESNDVRIVRLISVVTQKFISDVANDALQHCKSRSMQQGGNMKSKDRKYTLTMEDLAPALNDYGIQVRKSQYFP